MAESVYGDDAPPQGYNADQHHRTMKLVATNKATGQGNTGQQGKLWHQ